MNDAVTTVESPIGGLRSGFVSLVGAGPGDPELLTLRALRLLRQADVVVYDQLVSSTVMDLVPAHVQRIFAGKKASHHSMPQASINAVLRELALQGKRVVRLKGGDPFVFGRGGEEAQDLFAAGIGFEVVPGITAACGVGAYAGIPLTHRDHAQACVFVTGHQRNGTTDLDWVALARPNQTVVIYMGLGALAHICTELQRHGLSPEHPAAVIQEGTTERQRVVVAALSTLASCAAEAGLSSPALIIIGTVVSLRAQLLPAGQAMNHAQTSNGRTIGPISERDL